MHAAQIQGIYDYGDFILATLQVSVYLIRQPTKQLIQFVCFYCVYKSL